MQDTRERLESILRQRIAVLDGSWGVLIQKRVRGYQALKPFLKAASRAGDGSSQDTHSLCQGSKWRDRWGSPHRAADEMEHLAYGFSGELT